MKPKLSISNVNAISDDLDTNFGSRVQDARQISDLFVKPKQSITPIIEISERVLTLEALNHSISRYIGRLTRLGCATNPRFVREA